MSDKNVGEPTKAQEKNELDTAKPADFSFKKLKQLTDIHKFIKLTSKSMTEIDHIQPFFTCFKNFTAFDVEQARATRIGRTPERGQNHKFLTKAVWINNNKLTNVANLDVFLNSILEYPEKLGWIDLSFNYITHLDPILQKYVNLKIIYLHGNKIDNFDELKVLQVFPNLRSLTLHGNPIADRGNYRSYVLNNLLQIVNLDFTPISKSERLKPRPV